ncbi:MAG: bifunctional folylpolyglutamate synthase/dihydrofolate synthase [Chitinophagales bacterium]|nr:bifunctional folylpolyglutamate synthase/dihydrofolate synthase [Chitinophagales bacterium]
MNYQEVIEEMFARLPMFSNIGGAAYKANLSNTLSLCKSINNPQQNLRCVHIAGTNGKGSVSNMLASIFQEAGYKTGLYTSPHLKDFRERIRINGQMISEKDVLKYYALLSSKADEIQSSFFELTVVMSFAYFIDNKTDIAIIETGLGGRLDSTNVIQPDISIITNIGYDHQQFLGKTLDKIAFEKAGIIKKDKPVVIGLYQNETAHVFLEKSLKEKAPLYYSKDFNKNVQLIDNDEYISNNKKFKCPLTANYQTENITTVLSAIDVYNAYYSDMPISEKATFLGLKNILQNTGFQGRWQTIRNNPKVIVDVGHNIDGIREITKQLLKEKFNHLKIVYGAVKDKDVDSIINLLPKENTSYYLCEPPLPRKLPLSELLTIAENHDITVSFSHEDPKTAYNKALKDADKNDLILVLGSFFIVSEIL